MIPLFKPYMSKGVDKAVLETLHSGMIGQGPKVDEFERALVPWVGRETILTVNSCTSAITLALVLAGVEKDDEVISTPMTCAATNIPILNLGAKVVWADIDPRTGNIDPESVKRLVTHRTKAILVVHWGGIPCDLDAINALGKEYSIPVIEDAAHAFGARYNEKPIGSHSDFVCFSFQAIKHLTTGDGGLLSCKYKKDYEHGKLLRWYGIDRDAPGDKFLNDIRIAGYKFHMNDIAATIGLANLKNMTTVLDAHRNNAFLYNSRIRETEANIDASWWLYTLLPKRRDEFVKKLNQAGVSCSQVHGRNDHYFMFRGSERNLPGVDEFSLKQVSIPVGWWLKPQELEHIIKAVRT